MVERLRGSGISDERVLHAMRQVPRERFVPPDVADAAYQDHPLPIGLGQTISAPVIVALTTAAMQVGPDAHVLEIGTGSGYGAAVLSRCHRSVVTIERHPELAERARSALAGLGYDNVEGRPTGRRSTGSSSRPWRRTSRRPPCWSSSPRGRRWSARSGTGGTARSCGTGEAAPRISAPSRSCRW
jgi:protein-L-isoaspartate(D-aspartate) O-methyltransferase